MSRFKRLYDTLVKNEELLGMFPELSGDWLHDKEDFIRLQQEMEDGVFTQNTFLDDEYNYEG